MNIDLMLDIETVSTDNNAGVLSIAAVPFMWPEPLEYFYQKVDFNTLERKGFHLSKETLDWWGKQDKAARDEAFSGTEDIVDVLYELQEYIKNLPAPVNVWGNGSDFDNVILINAFDRCGIALPWSYKNNRCFRTLKNIFPHRDPVFTGQKHNALADAQHQAAHATLVLTDINDWLEPPQ